ncbi:MAG: DUF2194 domain-containing protein [Spirochaetota bacterium]|nr:DUF2194 domain-containing protein [Spirochaetota bacterium]
MQDMRLNLNRCFTHIMSFNNRYFIIYIISLFIVLGHTIFIRTAYCESYGKKILAMYKSSDQYSNKINPIKWYFESEIKKLGLQVQYHDFDSGMPDTDSLKNVRAILTWYNNAVVPDKKTGLEYIVFLNRAVDLGIKLIIVNSFGAYGYKDWGEIKWDLIDHIKPLFLKLGFNFKGYWTNDPNRIRILKRVSSIVENEAKQDVRKSKHFQQIIPIRTDVMTYLQIKRIDMVDGIGDGKSSVILTSQHGGFALEQYVMQGKKLLLKPQLFLRAALFPVNNNQDIATIIGKLKDRDSVKTNISYAYKYAKINNTFINADLLDSMILDDLKTFEVVIIVTDEVKNIPNSLITQYVQNGGKLIFIKYSKLNNEFESLLGLKEYAAKAEEFKEGFLIKQDFFLNRIPLSGEKIGLNVRRAILKKGNVLASVKNKRKRNSYPVLWERNVGKGKILYWNTDLIFDGKGFRGTIIQSIHYIHKGFVTGIANIGMMMIDDFPAPWWNINYKQNKLKYYNNLLSKEKDKQSRIKTIISNLRKYSNITDTEFIKSKWINDIISLGRHFGFKYSTYLIFNYGKDTGSQNKEDEFSIKDFYIAKGGLSLKSGSMALEKGWELGFHGYNHMSMTLKRPVHYASEPWDNIKSMIKALQVSRREWILLYGTSTLPFSYVAPHNIIDPAGLSAIAQVFPSIKVISALYIAKEGEVEQEFEWTRDNRFFQIPRISSGYYMSSMNKFVFYDCIHNFGIVSHFIHPDDVFNEYRSNKFQGWKWLKSRFYKDYSILQKRYPWIRWMTVKDAFSELFFYNSISISVKKKGKIIQVDTSDGSDRYFYFRVRLAKGQKISKLKNCKIVHTDKKSGDMIFKTRDHRSSIILR